MADADAIIIGAGLAGLVAAHELAAAGRKVILLEQEGENSIGGQAFWSLGGLFMVDSPEQRRLGIKDNIDLARQDWFGSARFDRPEDYWPKRWAEAYLEFAAGEMRPWLHSLGMRWFPVVGWAERGGGRADGHGNSVPRFHVTWGTGPAVVAPFERSLREAINKGLLTIKCRHRVNSIATTGGRAGGVYGEVLVPSTVERGQSSSRDIAGEFAYFADCIIVTTGGIGGDPDKVRRAWPRDRLGNPPKEMVLGVPAHVDGRGIDIAVAAGGHVINADRMWHYTEGLRNWAPIWPNHGIRILPGPSSIWFDAKGNRLPAPYLPGFDTLGTLKHILSTGYDYSWFILTEKIIRKEFSLSGSEQNPDLTGKDWKLLLKSRLGKAPPPPVKAFLDNGADFITAGNLDELVARMNGLTGEKLLNLDHIRYQIEARDREITNRYSKDAQVMAIHNARAYFGDRLTRAVPLHPLLEPSNGPLIAVKLHILTRKTLGGLHTDIDAQVLNAAGEEVPGLYAAGEAAGFGGGGYHGYNALEGTFLGGCIFSGRTAGRAAAAATSL